MKHMNPNIIAGIDFTEAFEAFNQLVEEAKTRRKPDPEAEDRKILDFLKRNGRIRESVLASAEAESRKRVEAEAKAGRIAADKEIAAEIEEQIGELDEAIRRNVDQLNAFKGRKLGLQKKLKAVRAELEQLESEG